MRWIMRGIAALAVPAVLAGMALATATGVAARGGGCGSPAGPPVVQVQGCINSTPGNVVNADAWVTWHAGTPPAGCSIIIALENADNGDILALSGVQGCTGGHHLGASVRNFFGRLINLTIINASSVEYQSSTRVFTCQPNAC
jgi:hypothetical protein